MPGTVNTEFAVGQQYWCVATRLSKPLLGTIIGLTDAVGKFIGLEFNEDIGGHSCDGRGKNGHCLWVTTQVIYNEIEWQNVIGVLSAQKEFSNSLVGNDYQLMKVETFNVQNSSNLIHAFDE